MSPESEEEEKGGLSKAGEGKGEILPTSRSSGGYSWWASGCLQYSARGSFRHVFLFLLPFRLLPQGVFSNASVLGQRAVAVLSVSGNSEAVFRVTSDVCLCFSPHSLPA